MKLYRTTRGVFVEEESQFYQLSPLVCTQVWDALICDVDLKARVTAVVKQSRVKNLDSASILPPVGSQEVWAAGVSYQRSRRARMQESKDAGGGDFYDRVYEAERPELFFKSQGWRVVGPRNAVRIRSDAKWSVPEPELTLVINPAGTIIGYTIGNDMSSRDIEGENPLYLPQAKVYDGSCALGPCILLSLHPPAESTIHLQIIRQNKNVCSGRTSITELKRNLQHLVEFLFRDQSFPQGVVLMTGTGIIPDDEFTLQRGDVIRIEIDGIGLLENYVA